MKVELTFVAGEPCVATVHRNGDIGTRDELKIAAALRELADRLIEHHEAHTPVEPPPLG